MIKLAYSINGFVETFLSFFLWPIQSLEPVWGLVFISFLTGVSIVWGYKLVSNQSEIVKARQKPAMRDQTNDNGANTLN